MDYRNIDVASLVASIKNQERSAEEVALSTLERIRKVNPRFNAFVSLYPEAKILEQARAVDAMVATGENPGPLAGVPVGVKDLEDVAGLATTYGSALYVDAPPVTDDSVAVSRLRAAGALIMGKTNTPEFGCKATTDNAIFEATRNPWNLSYSAGGSSGGSAAALAAGLVPLTTGCDDGGSIRIPAAICGFSGFKPSRGRIAIGDRMPPLSGVLGTRAPMALSINDTVLALDVMRGGSKQDIYALPSSAQSWRTAFAARRLPERMIWAPTLGFAEVDAGIMEVCQAAIKELEEAGVKILQRDNIFDDHPVDAWWTLWTSAMARRLGDQRGRPGWRKIDHSLREMIETGLATRGVAVMRAMDACHEFNLQLERIFAEAPLILSPTCAGVVPHIGAQGTVNGKTTQDWVEMTFGFNLTGNPAATVHAGLHKNGLPVGLQVVGRQQEDVAVLCAAGCLEDVLGDKGYAEF